MDAPSTVAPLSPAEKGAPQGTGQSGPELPQGGQADTVSVPSMIIRNGSATLEVDSLEAAVARVQQLARQVGGFVANTSMQTGEHEVRRATIELKIPANRFDQAVSGLRPLGKLESVNVTAEDVGEEFTDVTARVANARRLEERLLNLLATRTGRLEDVLAVERELARVREEIERYEGRLRYLRSRVAMSTLTVNLHESQPVIGAYPGPNPIVDAFRQAWRNFVDFVAGLIAALGFLIPLGLVLWAAWWLLRRVRGPGGGGGRRWFRRAPETPPTAGTGGQAE
ncbi:MAG TPA: DUF4349 domain-containing protein [Longimicrobiaceae bacterium]|nr:DUF4349 domain-containing protein [Longimicrobiaceae bacterium]